MKVGYYKSVDEKGRTYIIAQNENDVFAIINIDVAQHFIGIEEWQTVKCEFGKNGELSLVEFTDCELSADDVTAIFFDALCLKYLSQYDLTDLYFCEGIDHAKCQLDKLPEIKLSFEL